MSESEDDKARRLLTGQEKTALPRRFYKEVSIGGADGALEILLDGRPVKTPMKAPLALPGGDLADAVMKEWEAQVEHINPQLMPCTKLSNTAIDRVAGRRTEIVSEICDFAASDLVCYRADTPERLIERQSEAWDPLLAWMAQNLGARFISVTGLVHEPQPASTHAAVAAYLSKCGNFTLTALHNLATLTGSCVIAVTLKEGVLGAQQAWEAAHIDEDWQSEHWGADEEAQQRRAHFRAEYDATLKFLELAGVH